MTEHFTQAGMKDLCGDLGLSFYPRYFSDDDLMDLCNAAVNHKLKEWGAQEPVGYILPTTGKFVHASTIAAGHAGAHWEKLYAAPVAPAQDVNAGLVAAVQANHEWHQLYDEHGGYPGSDLEEQNIAALSQAKQAPVQGVLEGWKLVPVEPTNNMKSTASQLFAAKPKATPADFYRAMLAAAPQQEQKGGAL